MRTFLPKRVGAFSALLTLVLQILRLVVNRELQMPSETRLLESAVTRLLTEMFHGPSESAAWVLGRGDQGLLTVVESLSAEVASRRPMPGRYTIAAHTSHVHYHLQLLNRWAGGEENPFANADWETSWQPQVVSDSQWQDLLGQLREQAEDWIKAVQQPRNWDEISLTGALASVAHMAYHLGAIRQIVVAHGIRETLN